MAVRVQGMYCIGVRLSNWNITIEYNQDKAGAKHIRDLRTAYIYTRILGKDYNIFYIFIVC